MGKKEIMKYRKKTLSVSCVNCIIAASTYLGRVEEMRECAMNKNAFVVLVFVGRLALSRLFLLGEMPITINVTIQSQLEIMFTPNKQNAIDSHFMHNFFFFPFHFFCLFFSFSLPLPSFANIGSFRLLFLSPILGLFALYSFRLLRNRIDLILFRCNFKMQRVWYE